MVATPETDRERWARLIDDGLTLAAQAAVDRLGDQAAVETDFQRVARRLDDAMNGEPNDIATLVLHASLISLLEKSVERPAVN